MVDVAGPGDGGTDPLAHGGQHLQVQFPVVDPHADPVTGDDLLGGFRRGAVEFDVPGAHGGGRIRAGLEDPYRPHPHVDADGKSVGLGHRISSCPGG